MQTCAYGGLGRVEDLGEELDAVEKKLREDGKAAGEKFPKAGESARQRIGCRPFHGLHIIGMINPGACAPGFMLTPAPQAERKSNPGRHR